jgi:arylsulfatase A-like enzyme
VSFDKRELSRRSVLLASTSLAAVSALGSAASIQTAQAQQQPASSGRPPNILVIMGDDIGYWNIGAYHRGGIVMKKLKDIGVDDNTIVVFTTDNGTEVFTWPDGGQTPFAQSKGTVLEGGFRVPAIVRWPGKVPAGKVENGLISGLDWFPTLLAAAGNPNIAEALKRAKTSAAQPTRCTSTATTSWT